MQNQINAESDQVVVIQHVLADLASQLSELQLELGDLLYRPKVGRQLLVPETGNLEVPHQGHQQVSHEGVHLYLVFC